MGIKIPYPCTHATRGRSKSATLMQKFEIKGVNTVSRSQMLILATLFHAYSIPSGGGELEMATLYTAVAELNWNFYMHKSHASFAQTKLHCRSMGPTLVVMLIVFVCVMALLITSYIKLVLNTD